MKRKIQTLLAVITLWILSVVPLYSNMAQNITEIELKSATQEQQSDRAFVLKAVAYDGYNLEYVSEKLRNDKEIVLKAIESFSEVLKFSGESLQNDRAFIKEAIKVNEYVLSDAKEKFQKDSELAFLAVKRNSMVLKFLPYYKRNKAFILELLNSDIDVFPYIEERLKTDRDIIKATQMVPYKYQGFEEYLRAFVALLLILFLYFFIFEKKKKWAYLGIALSLFIMVEGSKVYFVHGVFRQPYQFIDASHKFGLEPIHCWLGSEKNLSNVECYNMHVPEIYNDETSRVISFPVRVFRSDAFFPTQPPVIHLGGGGPGADMAMEYALDGILKDHNAFSLNQGRDFFVIDPRGAGLSKPRLNCREFTDNVLFRVKEGLSLEDELKAVEQDYAKCIEQFKKSHINFNGYNSIAIADDVEMLRKAVNVDEWVLFGVSYSTIYAMFVAKKYPDSVNKMILDSSCFPNLKQDHNYRLQVMDRFNALYNYKDKITDSNLTNKERDMNVSAKIWTLYDKLNEEPLMVNSLGLKVNGNYFIESLLWGVYGTTIFNDLPKILTEIEHNSSKTFASYFDNYLYWLQDESYGDVSAMAHYCYEDIPFLDLDFIKRENLKLPKGYIQKSSILLFEMNDFCKEMNITSVDRTLNEPIKTDVPTLFIHGEFDSVTPLRDVKEQMRGFENAKLLTYKKAHSVLSDGKIEDDVAQFLVE